MTEQTRNEIVRRWRAGASMRRIARELGLARNTVSLALRQVEGRRAGDGSGPERRPCLLDPYEPVIRELLARYPDLNATTAPGGAAAAGLHRRLHRGPPAAPRTAPHGPAGPGDPLRDRPGSPGPDGLLPLSTSTSPAKAAAACTPSATCWATRAASTSASSSPRTSPPPCASTSAPSSTWAGSRRPASTTT